MGIEFAGASSASKSLMTLRVARNARTDEMCLIAIPLPLDIMSLKKKLTKVVPLDVGLDRWAMCDATKLAARGKRDYVSGHAAHCARVT